MSSAPFYPEHDRTSCSDAHPINHTAEGSTGCARCTALHLDRGEEAERLLRVAREALRAVSVLYPRRTILAEVNRCRTALAEIDPFLEA